MPSDDSLKAHSLGEATGDLELYAKEVLEKLYKESIPPTPTNFEAYFEKLLEEKPRNFRQRILKLLELEDDDDTHHGALEQYLKEAFESIKKLLQHINLIYKNLRHLETLIEKRTIELEAASERGALQTLLESLKKDLGTMSHIIKNDAGNIKNLYNITIEQVRQVQENAVYDDRFGVYKKNYLLRKIEQELKLIAEFQHESSLMVVQIKDGVTAHIKSPKIAQLMLRTVARLLLKTSRRSDLVAHYEKSIFAILMRHTNLESSQRAAERLKDLVSNTNFFVGDEEVILDVAIGIARIDPDRSIESSIVCALQALEQAQKSDESSHICQQDIEA